MPFIHTEVCHSEVMKMTAEWQNGVPQRQQKQTQGGKILHHNREIRALSAKVTYHSLPSFWLTIILRPFRCSIRTDSIASEAAQSIRQTVDSAGRASISHGVIQSTRGDLRSTTVLADAVQVNWRHYSRMPLNHKVHRKKNAFMHLSCNKPINYQSTDANDVRVYI